tara:strand:- start:217 stop:795 length:579 start_codon:yes stop_codon:yes gene_type:complete
MGYLNPLKIKFWSDMLRVGKFYYMRIALLILFINLLIFNQVIAACDDAPTDGVDYSNCQFSEEQDLSRAYIPNSNLSFISFIKVILDKAVMMNSSLINSNFSESSFFKTNLYESNLEGGNFEKANFSSANLTRVNFKGTSLIEANFSNSNLFEADFTGANILNSNFEGANLNNATWVDGKKCNLGSIGECIK